MAVTIRPARSGDEPPIWAVHTRAIRHGAAAHYPAPDIAAWSARATPASYAEALLTRIVLVAQHDNGRIVGFAQLDPTEGILEAVYVDPDAARRGVGRTLVEAIEREARSRAIHAIVLDASLNAVPFYEALGYRRECETQHALGGGRAIACILMSKRLDDSARRPSPRGRAREARRRSAKGVAVVLALAALIAAIEFYAIRTLGRK